MPQISPKLVLIIMGFDTLGILLAVGLSLAWHGAVFDPMTWMLTFFPMCILGTAIGVWQVMKTLR